MSKPISRLKEEREKKFLSQAELAGASGVSQSTISFAEAGARVSLGSIKKLALALGIKPERLI